MRRIEEGSREWNKRALEACLCHMRSCGKCGSPHPMGLICDFCGDVNPETHGPTPKGKRKQS